MILRFFVSIFLSLLSFLSLEANDRSFVVIIPSYNNKDRYEENLDSVFFQTYQNFRVIYVDDASEDGTADLVKAYIRKHNLDSRVTLIRNQKRVGTLANVYRAAWLCYPTEVIVDLDGDDRLAHSEVFSLLNEIYSDDSVWLTYGDWIYNPSQEIGGALEVPLEVIDRNEFRSFHRGGTTPLRTFYAGLFQQIKREDLLYEGKFLQTASDLAFMFPMLEMAGRHTKFIPDILYVYNNETPFNDHHLRYQEQLKMDGYLRGKKKYQPLTHYCHKAERKKIYITPGQWGQLFALDNPTYNRDNCLNVTVRLREFAAEFGYDLIQVSPLDHLSDFEYLICFDIHPEHLNYLKRYPKEKLILFLWEPPSTVPDNFVKDYHYCFSKIYTWDDSLVDDKKYFKFYYPAFLPRIPSLTPFSSKRLSTMIAYNKTSFHPYELYGERKNVIHYFESLPEGNFDLYGKNWPSYLKNYKGPVEKKVDCQKLYKFCFAYENVWNIPGYISEKIFDCFHAGTVPIYWGASNIYDYIPKECFIDRTNFLDEFDLHEHLISITEDEYNQYMINTEKFLESDQAQLYSQENFFRIFMELITTPPGA